MKTSQPTSSPVTPRSDSIISSTLNESLAALLSRGFEYQAAQAMGSASDSTTSSPASGFNENRRMTALPENNDLGELIENSLRFLQDDSIFEHLPSSPNGRGRSSGTERPRDNEDPTWYLAQ